MPAYEKCPECDRYAVHLTMAHVPTDQFFGDQDDRNGQESIYLDEPPPGYEVVRLYAHFCFECGNLVELGIEEPRELDTATKQIGEIKNLFSALVEYAKNHNGRIDMECTAYRKLREMLIDRV